MAGFKEVGISEIADHGASYEYGYSLNDITHCYCR